MYINEEHLMQAIPFSEARAHLAETLQHIEEGGSPVCISRRGKAAAVLMSMASYQQMTRVEQGFNARLAAWRQTHITEHAIDDEFSSLRQIDTGRDFSW
jgi:prevent-host-death family protein